jgi:hypothetical protein
MENFRNMEHAFAFRTFYRGELQYSSGSLPPYRVRTLYSPTN